MNNRLINYFLKFTNLTSAEAEALTESMDIKKIKKGTYLIKEGQLSNSTFFILEGCVRQFINVDGNDITTNFFTEEQWIMSLENFDANTPSKNNLICVEDTTIVTGNEQKAQELFNQNPRFETISRHIVEKVFSEQLDIMTSHITEKPEQRYLKLLETRPDLFQRVPQYDIASYIGVKPESLSRIRKKLLKKD